jgi:hypothetical protein
VTWSEAAGRDRETFTDLEDQARRLAPRVAAELTGLLLKAYDRGAEVTCHEFQVIWDRQGRVRACGCAECEPAAR